MSDLAWFGIAVFEKATQANLTAMKKAAILVERNAKKIMGSQARAQRKPRKRRSRKILGGLFTISITKKRKASRSGAKRRTKAKKKRHVPSTAGNPPNIDTGILRASITHTIDIKDVGGGEPGIVGFVGSDIDYIRANAGTGTDVQYGFYLEVGTVKMQARPWLRPALRRSENGILRIFKEANS